MTWEIDRTGNSELRGESRWLKIPLRELASATEALAAECACHHLEGALIADGELTDAAPGVTSCLVTMLSRAHARSRYLVLELLERIAMAGGPCTPRELRHRVEAELARGVASYFAVLETGGVEERAPAVTLLGMAVQRDVALRDRVVWYFRRLLAEPLPPSFAVTVRAWVDDLEGTTLRSMRAVGEG
jgi:hypothetical protein